MNLKEKLAAYNNLKAPQHAEKDIELLKKKAPEHSVLKSPFTKSDRQANEVLRALLDHVDSPTEIVENRRKKENSLAEFGVTINRIKEWNPVILKADNSNKVKLEAVKAITGLLEIIPENIRKHLPGDIEGFSFDLLAEDLYLEDPKEIMENAGVLTAKLYRTTTPKERKLIFNEIKELVKDFLKEDQELILKLPVSICEKMDNALPSASNEEKVAEGSGEENTEVESLKNELEEKESENENLEEKLLEKKEENEDLEEQLEESEEEKEKLLTENFLLKADLSKLPYPDKKKILFDLNLDEGLSDLKSDTITPVLLKKQSELLAVSSGGQKKS